MGWHGAFTCKSTPTLSTLPSSLPMPLAAGRPITGGAVTTASPSATSDASRVGCVTQRASTQRGRCGSATEASLPPLMGSRGASYLGVPPYPSNGVPHARGVVAGPMEGGR